MSKRRLSMRSVKELLRLKYDAKLSVRQISQVLKIGKSSVGDYLSRFRATGLDYPLATEIGDDELEKLLFYDAGKRKNIEKKVELEYIHSELKRPNVTMQLLWEEYKQNYPNGHQYSWFCQIYREHQKSKNISLRQVHKYGEKGYCDFGKGIKIYDPKSSESKQTQLYVFVWGASNYTYAEATLSEKTGDWIKGTVNALHHSGCVPKAIVPDQPKPVVSKACIYDPEINPVFIEFGMHYHTTIFPARPRKPKDKSKVEVGVQISKRWILAKLRNCVFHGLGELNEEIQKLVKQLNEKPMKKINKSRKDIFESCEKIHALDLPKYRYQVSEWQKVSVSIDHHIEFDDHYYSVPYTLIKKRLDVRSTTTTIEVFKKDHRVAMHQRSNKVDGYTTCFEHRPPSHQKFLEWTPEKILKWAQESGKHTSDLIQKIVSTRQYPEQAYRVCLGIMRLEKKFSKERLNNACKRSLDYQVHTYLGIKNILIKRLDEHDELHSQLPAEQPLSHENIRGPHYYQAAKTEKSKSNALPII